MITITGHHPMLSMRPAILAAMLTLACSATGAAHAEAAARAAPQAAATVGAAHAAAVRNLLEALGIAMVARYQMANTRGGRIDAQELAQHMARFITDDEIYNRLTPIYAKYISAASANQLSAYYRGSVGRRQLVAGLARQGILKGEKNPYFTASELREIHQADAWPATLEVNRAQAQIGVDSRKLGEQWGKQYSDRLAAQAFKSLQEVINSAMQRKPGDPPRQLMLQKTGLATFDKIVFIVADSSLHTIHLNRNFTSDLATYDLERVLSAERLVSAEGIAASRVSLASASERTERHLADMDRLQRDYVRRMTEVSPHKDMLQEVEQSMTFRYDLLVRMGENQRGLLDLFARVLSFAESRLGTVRLEGDALMFQSDADVAAFQSMMDQVRAGNREEEELNAAAAKHRKQASQAAGG